MGNESGNDADQALVSLTDAVFSGRDVPWEEAVDTTPPAERSVLQQLRRIASVIAAHETQQATALRPGPDGALDGEAWGPLVIQEQIGSGAFGDVYRAHEPRLDRQVALKFFLPHRLSRTQLTSDVIEEGRLLARVRHPNVVTVHGAEHRDGRFGIWMEFIEGRTLEEVVTDEGPLDATAAAAIGRDLCAALAALHDAGILHRDIKARNVMREESGRVVLMDLGISCEVDGEAPISLYGTPFYAAPEVLRGGEPSKHADIYGLGVLLYFLVSGRYPVAAESLPDLVAAHAEGRATPLAELRPELPRALVAAVARALAATPEERFESAAAMGETLAAILVDDGGGEVTVDGGSTAQSARASTDNRQAYLHYLNGRQFWNVRYRGQLPQALECFQRAVELDPDFALAHVGVADCMNIISVYGYVRPHEGFGMARAAAERALALAPDLGEAQSSLGWVAMWYDWDFPEAERRFHLAFEMSPWYGLARQWYAYLLMNMGRFDEALAQLVECRDLDPATVVAGAEGIVLAFAGRFGEAVEFLDIVLETDPNSPHHNTNKGLARLMGGELEAAEASLRTAIEASRGEHTFAVSILGNVYARMGREDAAREQIDFLAALSERRYVSPYYMLAPWLDLKRPDRWEPLLETAIAERDPTLSALNTVVRLLEWNDPRFTGPLRRVGLLD